MRGPPGCLELISQPTQYTVKMRPKFNHLKKRQTLVVFWPFLSLNGEVMPFQHQFTMQKIMGKIWVRCPKKVRALQVRLKENDIHNLFSDIFLPLKFRKDSLGIVWFPQHSWDSFLNVPQKWEIDVLKSQNLQLLYRL